MRIIPLEFGFVKIENFKNSTKRAFRNVTKLM